MSGNKCKILYLWCNDNNIAVHLGNDDNKYDVIICQDRSCHKKYPKRKEVILNNFTMTIKNTTQIKKILLKERFNKRFMSKVGVEPVALALLAPRSNQLS